MSHFSGSEYNAKLKNNKYANNGEFHNVFKEPNIITLTKNRIDDPRPVKNRIKLPRWPIFSGLNLILICLTSLTAKLHFKLGVRDFGMHMVLLTNENV